uniref:Uncharacterized protein n=1 Tax=Romanomermis culicivorax TaxID=13658 RepID=A0A915J5Y2_ROMCU
MPIALFMGKILPKSPTFVVKLVNKGYGARQILKVLSAKLDIFWHSKICRKNMENWV